MSDPLENLHEFLSLFEGNEDRSAPMSFRPRVRVVAEPANYASQQYRSPYQTPPIFPRRQSRVYSSTSSATSQSTRQSSVWGGPSSTLPFRRTSGAQSITNSNTTRATSVASPAYVSTRRQTRTADTIGALDSHPSGSYMLPCEFGLFGYSRCSAVFRDNETEHWIEHVIEHLDYHQLPQTCICWYCDEFEYCTGTVDKQTNYCNRMWHIREHIVENHPKSLHIRPDYHFVQHLCDLNKISPQTYDKICRQDEGHQMDGIYRHDFVPPNQARAQARAQELNNRVIVTEGRTRPRHSHKHRG